MRRLHLSTGRRHEKGEVKALCRSQLGGGPGPAGARAALGQARCGNEAIYGGSYGWASAGRFHHAQSQLHRFLKGFGGYTASTNTYSSAAGERILPHILGPLSPLHRQHTHFSELARECQLFVAIGGLPLRNARVNSGGANDHMLQYWLDKMQANGTRFINISPVRNDLSAVPDAEWLAIQPGTDTALLLALSYVLIAESLYDRAFVASHTVGFALTALICWASTMA